MTDKIFEVALYNPSDVDVIEFPIWDCLVDDRGNPRIGDDKQPVTTGKTLTWSIASKETIIFPKYVADHLRATYEFLEVVPTPSLGEPEPFTTPSTSGESATGTADSKTSGEVTEELSEREENQCRLCKGMFKNKRALAFHMAAKHSDFITR